ncbi:MTG-like gene family protein [Betaentomopoxvirus amoorei]|uniref:AMV207 n=1 Tax=Amsacta moorei entomopoxvirus TaxID=28321 RepID=Q9EMJ9_AMEPV|nr:MTG-like gene family protein [Amsacta moorei entomopoxvirus]AAG02913.1 AMV207 [Amsacta moorei entomopoxvirus]
MIEILIFIIKIIMNYNIKIENNKYSVKDIFTALNYTNYEEYFEDNEDRYYSLRSLKKIFNECDNEKELIKYIENNTLMDVSTFITYNNYDIELGSWFKDIWFPLFNKKNVVITNEILNFIYNFQVGKCFPTYNLDNYIQYKKDYRSFLKKNNIEYNIIKYDENILNKYNILKSELKLYDKHALVQKTWLILSVDDFKESIMMMNNNNSKMIRKYYIKIEKILFEYSTYISKYKLKEIEDIKNKELLKLKEENNNLQRFNMNMKNFINNVKEKNKNGYIYIATSERYAMINNFKVGKTDNLSSRQSNFNSSHNTEDEFYICYYEKVFNISKTENLIHDLLDNFRDKKRKEIFVIHYKYLLDMVNLVIKNINEPYDYINNLIKNKLSEMYNLKPIIPNKIIINDKEIELNEIKEKITNILDEYIKNNNLKISRIELLNKINIDNINKIKLWDYIKQIFEWKNSKTPINYNDKKLTITY